MLRNERGREDMEPGRSKERKGGKMNKERKVGGQGGRREEGRRERPFAPCPPTFSLLTPPSLPVTCLLPPLSFLITPPLLIPNPYPDHRRGRRDGGTFPLCLLPLSLCPPFSHVLPFAYLFSISYPLFPSSLALLYSFLLPPPSSLVRLYSSLFTPPSLPGQGTR